MQNFYPLVFVFLLLCNTVTAQFNVIDTGTFKAKEDKKTIIKKVVLLEKKTPQNRLNKLILFKTKLQVNTDGTPLSYHPLDLEGKEKAINKIGNGVAIYKDNKPGNRFLTGHYSESLAIFRKYCESNFVEIPEGFKIVWQNVIAAYNGKPCIFKTGKYAGYFGSMTTLKNDLPAGQKGECDCEDQVNPLTVNSFVIPLGNKHVLRRFRADTGDLIIAYNPRNAKLVYAIINDKGPADKLGEGSVALNKALLGKDTDPHTVAETYQYGTRNDIVIAIIPASRNYNVVKPFNNDNIRQRITDIMHTLELNTDEEVINFMKENSRTL